MGILFYSGYSYAMSLLTLVPPALTAGPEINSVLVWSNAVISNRFNTDSTQGLKHADTEVSFQENRGLEIIQALQASVLRVQYQILLENLNTSESENILTSVYQSVPYAITVKPVIGQ